MKRTINLANPMCLIVKEPEAERVLRDGLARSPSSAELHYALRLSLTRSRRAADATVAFKVANDLAPEVARFAYAYALTLKQSGQVAAAVRILGSALTRHPDDWDMLLRWWRSNATLDTAAAREHAARLRTTYPADGEACALFESLREQR
jgi:predicted Zn-dependent protease